MKSFCQGAKGRVRAHALVQPRGEGKPLEQNFRDRGPNFLTNWSSCSNSFLSGPPERSFRHPRVIPSSFPSFSFPVAQKITSDGPYLEHRAPTRHPPARSGFFQNFHTRASVTFVGSEHTGSHPAFPLPPHVFPRVSSGNSPQISQQLRIQGSKSQARAHCGRFLLCSRRTRNLCFHRCVPVGLEGPRE